MKSTILAVIAGFGALTAAQSLSSLPTCAQSCVGSSFGGCSALDIKCICSNTDLISQLSCCVSTTCSPADQATTEQFASELCAADGVTLPTSASCAASASATAASSSGATSGAAAPIGTGSSASSMASSMASSTASSTASSMMSSMSSMSSSMVSTSSATAATGSSSATPASSASGSATAASTSSTGGASHLLGSNMGAAGAAIAALVLL